MSSDGVDIAALGIKVDATDISGANKELNKLNSNALKVTETVKLLKQTFAELGQLISASYGDVSSKTSNHLSDVISKERELTSKFKTELTAREFEAKASYNRRFVQLSNLFNEEAQLQQKMLDAERVAREQALAKEKQLQETGLFIEQARNNSKVAMYAKMFDDIAALENAAQIKSQQKKQQLSNSLNAFQSETQGLLSLMEQRLQLEQTSVVRGENTKAAIRQRYAQQERQLREQLNNSLLQIQATYENGIITKVESLTAREQVLSNAERALIANNEQLASSLQHASDAADLMHRGMGKVYDMLIRMAAYRIITIFADFPSQVFEINKDFQLLRINLEGVMKSAEGARLEFKRLQELDIKTPFDLQELAKADLMMRNFGLAMSDSQFKAITDQVSQLGGTSETLTGILRQLGQAWGKNRLQLVDLRPMIEQGLPAIKLLGDAYGKNSIEILEMVHNGELGQEAITKLFDAMERNAPDAAAKNMNTLNGAMSNVKSSWEQMIDAMMGSRLESMITTTLELVSSFLFSMRDLFNGEIGKWDADFLMFISKFAHGMSNVLESKYSFGGIQATSDYFKRLSEQQSGFADEQNKKDHKAMDEADKARVADQAKQLEEFNKFEMEHQGIATKGAKSITDIDKGLAALKKENLDSELAGIKQVKDAKLDALEVDKSNFDWQLEHNKISIQEFYESQLDLIAQVKKAKLDSIDAEITAEERLRSQQLIAPAKGSLSSLISGVESGGAGYDAFNRGVAGDTSVSVQKSQHISALTIGEIMAKQALSNSNAENLGAVGKYQVIQKTLKAAVDTLKLTEDTKFDAATQEKIFTEYLLTVHKQPGFANFVTGKSSDVNEALRGLSNEFASFASPDKANGAGAYDDVAGNKALIALDTAKKATIAAQQLYSKAIAAGLSEKDAFTVAITGQAESLTEQVKVTEKVNDLKGKGAKVEQESLQKTIALSSDVLAKQKAQSDAIEAQELKVKKLTTSESDLSAIRANAAAEQALALEKNKAYQEAKTSGDGKGAAAFEAEARINVEEIVVKAEIKQLETVRDAKVKSFEMQKTALDFNLSQQTISNEEFTTKSIDLIHKELAVKLNTLDTEADKYKKIGIPFADYQTKRIAIIEESKQKEKQLTNAAIANSNQYQETLAKEELALFKLSHTAQEVAAKEKELFFKFDKGYAAAVASDKTTGRNDAGVYVQQQNLLETKKVTDASIAHQQSLIKINREYKELGLNASDAFNIINGGAGAIATAFDSFIQKLDQLSAKFQQNAALQTEFNAARDAGTIKGQDAIDTENALANQYIELQHQKTQATLNATAQILGSAKGLFKEHTAGYKLMEAGEKAFRALEIYNAVKNFAIKSGYLVSELVVNKSVKVASIAADTEFTAASIIQSGRRAATNAVEAISKVFASIPPPYSFVLAGVTAAALAAIGISIAGGFNSGTPVNSDDRQKTQGTGTVLGDATAKSDSINKSLQSIKDTDLTILPLTGQMAKSLQSIEANIAGLGSLLSRTIYNGGNAPKIDGLGKSSNYFISNFLTDMIFGTTTKTLDDFGLFIKSQTIPQIKALGLEVEQFTTVTTKSSAFFGLFSSSNTDTQLSPVDRTATDQFTKILLGIVDSVGVASKQLGVNASDFQKRINDFVLNIGYVSLKGLKGQELQDALQAIFSKAADQIAFAVYSGLNEFQKVGEGYYETLIRVATGIEQANTALLSLNITAIAYGSIINKQGDVFAEIVRQSIMNVEQQNGVLNSVGQIIETLQGTGSDLIATYKSLLDIRNLLVASGLDKNALSTSLIQGAGSLSDLAANLTTYNDKYFTQAEQIAAKTKEMGVEFAKLGYIMPTSEAGFRKLVSGINTTTDSGKILLGQVLKLAGSFDDLQSKVQGYTSTLENAVLDSYNTAKDLLQKQIDQYANFIKSLKSLSDSLLIGPNSILSNADQYHRARGEVSKYENLLATGTDAQKQEAMTKLPGLIQQFLDLSRKYNASGIGYVKDFTDMQSLIAKNSEDAQKQEDIYHQQLDQLTKQVTALGLIKKSVDNVQDAVNAVGIAITSLKAFQAAQQISQKESANKTAFGQYEQNRLDNYNANIAKGASGKQALGSAIEHMVGWAAGSSKHPFSATGQFNASTGQVVGNVQTTSGGGNAGAISEYLKSEVFPRLADSLSLVGHQIQNIIGGVLPTVDFKFGDSEDEGPGYADYSFGGKHGHVSTDDLPTLQRLFAKDMTSYLASQLSNKDWASKLAVVDYPTLGQGLANLFTMFSKLKNPFEEGKYDSKVDYLKKLHGSHKDGLMRVPFDGYIAELHKDERVLTAAEATTFNSQPSKKVDASSEVNELKEEIAKLRKQLAEQINILKDSNAVERQGFNEVIKELKTQGLQMFNANRNNARVVREKS